MKRLLLLLLFTNFVSAQHHFFELRLVNDYVGITDVGLNTILQNNNVTYFHYKNGHPYLPYFLKMYNISCYNCDANKLMSELQSYSSVVENVVNMKDNNIFSDALITHIANPNIGLPIGTNNNVVITNDSGLNQIFLNYNVFYYATYLSSGSGNLMQYYNVVCNCDATLLKIALDNYSSVTDKTAYINPVYLGTDSFNSSKASIFPNPFTSTFNIQTTENISNYSIFDISGKQIIKTNSKIELDNQALNLTSGMYILKLESENKKVFSQKLIKL